MSDVLRFPTDIPMRRRLFGERSFAHPAKLHLGFLQFLIDRYTQPGETIMDPMAGIGSILLAATQQRNVIAREIEPQWLEQLHENAAEIYRHAGLLAGSIEIGQADARRPWEGTTDHIIFSPPYGCAAAATPNQRRFLPYKLVTARGLAYNDRWRRLAETPTPGSVGAVNFYYGGHPDQIGHLRKDAYWEAMSDVYQQALAALQGGVMVVILKDHIKDGARVRVCDQTAELCQDLGFILIDRHQRLVYPLSLWQRRRKERGEPVVEEEEALVFRKVL